MTKEVLYQICTKTIMDTTADPDIRFDENGVCNYVEKYEALIRQRVPDPETAKKKLASIVAKIKKDGEGKEYDCIIGVSGGVDSTYVAYLVKNLGLRPLAVHMDNGWNSELAVGNIEKTLMKLNIDLHTEVLDWAEFKDIQLAFLKASTPDCEIPTEQAIYTTFFRTAARYGVKYVISGTNIKTEGILPRSWSSGHIDWKYVKSVHKLFGTRKLRSFPHTPLLKFVYYIAVKRIKMYSILDLIDYNKNEAIEILEKELGWTPYGGKHYESIYTRFYQGYILPVKFKMDKRRGHLSTLICSGQITREEALEEIAQPPYASEDFLKKDYEFVLKKLGITREEFEAIMKLPEKRIYDYPNNFNFLEKLRSLYNKYKKIYAR